MSRILVTVTLLVSSLAAAQSVKYELDGQRLKVPHKVMYETSKATLLPSSGDALVYVSGYLEAKSYISTMRIEVHSDAMGNDGYNQALSEKRALAVAKALVRKGVDCKRLLPVGFGETKPIADNQTAEGRAQNRRTEFVNAALKGRAVGGMPLDGGGRVAGDPCK
jgi:OmpA-OmpF porin, OOP family